MAKPSIFSRDYENRMKRRKRKILIIALILVIGSLIAFFKVEIQDADFSELRAQIQEWIDSDKPKEEIAEEKKDTPDKSEVDEKAKIEDEKQKEAVKTYVDLNLASGVILKAEYTEENGEKKFIGLDGAEGIQFIISPSAKQILITEKNQDLKLFNIDGVMKDVTKKSYVSQAGSAFQKDEILKNTPTYLWHSQVKFIDETRIAYVSQMPYFGDAAVNRYIWIYDTVSAKENAIWNLPAPDITLGEIDPAKGISATINGGKYFVNGEGVVTQ